MAIGTGQLLELGTWLTNAPLRAARRAAAGQVDEPAAPAKQSPLYLPRVFRLVYQVFFLLLFLSPASA